MPLDRFAMRALAALLLCAAVCAHAAPTHLRGHVTSHLTGLPVDNAFVEILDADGNFVPGAYAVTDPSGAYSWSGDCPDNGNTCIAQMSAGSIYFGVAYETLQAPFSNGAADAVIDFFPHVLGRIDAVLTGPNGAPVANSSYLSATMQSEPGETALPIVVFAFDANAQAWHRLESLRSSYEPGLLTVRGLPPGRYRVCAGGIDMGLQRQCFDHKQAAQSWAKQTYTDIDLAEGEQRTLPFDLVAGGSISGELLDTYKNQPLSTDAPNKAVRVALYDTDGVLFDRGTTFFGDDSHFRVLGTPKGKFRIATGMLDLAYREQHVLFPAIPCPGGVCPLDRGTPIDTDIAGDVGGIDLALHPSVVIRGRVTDVDTHLPVAGALVDDTWYLQTDFNEAPPIPVTHETHSDADGNYVVYAPAAPPVYLRASGPPYLSTCGGASTCDRFVTNAATQTGDTITADIALQLGGSFSGTLRDVLGHDARAMLSIYDSRGQWVYSFGDERYFVSIGGAFRSPALPPGTYYAMASFETGSNSSSGKCQVYASRRCPASTAAQALLDAAPTPIVIVAGDDRSGVDFTLVLDGVFTDGFEQRF